MHAHDILHRDIKPENIVLSNVPYCLFRVFANFATLDGLHIAVKEEKLIVAHWIMCVLKFWKANLMITLWTYGPLVF